MGNQKGFSLIQVMIASAIFSIVSLSMANLIIGQVQATTRLEDQLSKIQLIRNFETILKNELACQSTLEGVAIQSQGSTDVASLKDNAGAVIYESNRIEDNLKIGQISVSNDSVSGPSSSGFVDIIVPIRRVRSNHEEALKPLNFKIEVSVDALNKVTDCGSGGPQDWVAVGRASNTWYTNETGQSISVAITAGDGSFQVRKNSSAQIVTLGTEVGGGDNLRGVYVVPSGYQYMKTGGGSWVWSELR